MAVGIPLQEGEQVVEYAIPFNHSDLTRSERTRSLRTLHFLLPMSIPIFLILFSPPYGLFLMDRNLQSPISAWNTGTRQLGLPHSR